MKSLFLVLLIFHSCYGRTEKFVNNPPRPPPPPPTIPPPPEIPTRATVFLTNGQVHVWDIIRVWDNLGDSLIVEGRLDGVNQLVEYDGCDVEMIIDLDPFEFEPLTCI